jgi:hypothetical protein
VDIWWPWTYDEQYSSSKKRQPSFLIAHFCAS